MKCGFKVTFDKNTYEFLVDPDKPGLIPEQDRNAYKSLHNLLASNVLIPFISETILTHETIARSNRLSILTHPNPIKITTIDSKIIISPNPAVHPGHHAKDERYLTQAIQLGFKILPGKRFGKLINPSVLPAWYYETGEDYMSISQRFSDIIREIQDWGCGFAHMTALLEAENLSHLPMNTALLYYKGTPKKLNAAIAEWSDADSVGLHLAYNLDYFCSKDEGKNAGHHAVFSEANCRKLGQRFGFRKVSPVELVTAFE